MSSLPILLLVDDDDTTNFLNTMLLQDFHPGVQVHTAGNGQAGLDLLRTYCQPSAPHTHCPTLVFLDINMPVLDGFGFLEAFQRLPAAEQQGVVIVMLTTSVNPRDLARLKGLPIAGFLSKPLNEKKLNQVLVDHFPPRPAAQ